MSIRLTYIYCHWGTPNTDAQHQAAVALFPGPAQLSVALHVGTHMHSLQNQFRLTCIHVNDRTKQLTSSAPCIPAALIVSCSCTVSNTSSSDEREGDKCSKSFSMRLHGMVKAACHKHEDFYWNVMSIPVCFFHPARALVSSPDPHQHSKRRRGLVNIVQHFCTSMEFQWHISDWLIWQLSHCTGFPTTNHLALLITPLQTYLAHLQFAEAQKATLKAELLAESIAIASPWCEAVLYSPDPPFLFGGGSGNETTRACDRFKLQNLGKRQFMW